MTEKAAGPTDSSKQLWAGLSLIGLMWPLNWLLPGIPTAYLFFPLWLGYILTVDAIVLRRRGSSLLTRGSSADIVMLFLISAVAWWLFEAVNSVLQNWHYLGREFFSDFSYALLATISFSTVMPAVFATAELVRSFPWVERLRAGPRIAPRPRNLVLFLAIGATMLTLTLLWPRHFYPLVWGAAYLILEPINYLLGRETLLERLRVGDWRPVVSLGLGALITGFFWELWNYYSFPKWVYDTPGADFLHVFEMPLLGYLGYPPFALELFALHALLRWRPLRVDL